MKTPQPKKVNDSSKTKPENTIQNTSFTYPKEKKKGERAKKKREKKVGIYKRTKLTTKLVIA